jgi:hypothetical protein
VARYCVLDAPNLIWRARHATGREAATAEDAVGLGLMTTFRSMRKVFNKFGCDHAVACFDHFSWRKVVLEGYKASRATDRGEYDEEQQRAYELTMAGVDRLRKFLEERTNVTVLHSHLCEADDFIGRWIQTHPNDSHVIVSGDSDYKQLVSENVQLYNGATGKLYTLDGVFYQDPMKLKKNQVMRQIAGETWKSSMVKPKPKKSDPDPQPHPELFEPAWELFLKVMRGDPGDDVPCAAPKGTFERDLREAFTHQGGSKWTTLMNTLRTDQPKDPETGQHPSVGDLYERNCQLIDLSRQPEEVKELLDQCISHAIARERVTRVGFALLEFCRQEGLVRLAEEAERIAPMLSRPYPAAT